MCGTIWQVDCSAWWRCLCVQWRSVQYQITNQIQHSTRYTGTMMHSGNLGGQRQTLTSFKRHLWFLWIIVIGFLTKSWKSDLTKLHCWAILIYSRSWDYITFLTLETRVRPSELNVPSVTKAGSHCIQWTVSVWGAETLRHNLQPRRWQMGIMRTIPTHIKLETRTMCWGHGIIHPV